MSNVFNKTSNVFLDIVKQALTREISCQLVSRLPTDEYYNFKFMKDVILVKDKNNIFHKFSSTTAETVNINILVIENDDTTHSLCTIGSIIKSPEIGRLDEISSKTDCNNIESLIVLIQKYINYELTKGMQIKIMENIKSLF